MKSPALGSPPSSFLRCVIFSRSTKTEAEPEHMVRRSLGLGQGTLSCFVQIPSVRLAWSGWLGLGRKNVAAL